MPDGRCDVPGLLSFARGTRRGLLLTVAGSDVAGDSVDATIGYVVDVPSTGGVATVPAALSVVEADALGAG